MATTTRRYLVIANQTLAEAELSEAIRERLEAGPSSFFVLVPNTDHGDLAARVFKAAPVAPGAGDATADGQATEHAQHRLGQLLADLRGVGAEADGDIGDPDPLKAAEQLLETRQFDEIILSTLPQHISRWLGMDLPHRLQRHSGLPVTTITAKRVL
jgi:GABA permease